MVSFEQLECRRLLSGIELDPTFGNGGRIDLPLGKDVRLTSIVARPVRDGKLVVAMEYEGAKGAKIEPTLMIMRFTWDGRIDKTFGKNGKIVEKRTGASTISGLYAMPDGSLLMKETYDGSKGGTGGTAAGNYWLRYTADGMQTASRQVGPIAAPAEVDAYQFMPGGKLLLGIDVNPEVGDAQVTLLNQDLTPDQSFGGGTAVDTGLTSVRTVTVQSDGKVLVTGEIYDPTYQDPNGERFDKYYFAMVRLNSDGSVDSTFGNKGLIKMEQPGVGDAVVLGSGKIMEVSFNSRDAIPMYILNRFRADGSPDLTFGVNGQKPIAANESSKAAPAPALKAPGLVAVPGKDDFWMTGFDLSSTRQEPGGGFPTAVVLGKYSADGEPDKKFGGDGFVQSKRVFDSNSALTVQPDGKMVLAGTTIDQRGVVLMRFADTDSHEGLAVLTEDGTLDVAGTPKADAVRVKRRGEKLVVTINDWVKAFSTAMVKRVYVHTGRGNDSITLEGDVPNAYVHAGMGNDTIWGGDGNDTLSGAEGDDLIYGGRGDDRINGGGGADMLFGGEGNDRVYGGGGRDKLDGGAGENTLNGGAAGDKFMNVGQKDVVIEGTEGGDSPVAANQ